MTEQEYNEVVAKVSSEDPHERLQALFLEGLFPEWGSGNKYKADEVEGKLRSLLGGISDYAE